MKTAFWVLALASLSTIASAQKFNGENSVQIARESDPATKDMRGYIFSAETYYSASFTWVVDGMPGVEFFDVDKDGFVDQVRITNYGPIRILEKKGQVQFDELSQPFAFGAEQIEVYRGPALLDQWREEYHDVEEATKNRKAIPPTEIGVVYFR